jgi:hypothetical protein
LLEKEMNVNLKTPISITLTSAKLFSEGDGVGVIEFQLLVGQPARLVIPTTDYLYDTALHVGDRVKLNTPYSSFGVGSEGVLQEIIIDSTQDMADVLFDKILPVQVFQADVVETSAPGDISIMFRVPFSYLEAA